MLAQHLEDVQLSEQDLMLIEIRLILGKEGMKVLFILLYVILHY
jgi:hypothetical protein